MLVTVGVVCVRQHRVVDTVVVSWSGIGVRWGRGTLS